MELPNNLINEILNYLAKQPYKEVAGMINAIVQRQANSKQEELPLDED
jgi:hypothetical protein|tara:strand:+ start:544 stop:687 length:144 start_codon:yes stop_codon:yes gene_type:complete